MKRAVGILCFSIAIPWSCAALGEDFTGLTGGGQPRANMQPSLAMNYLVRTQPSNYFALGEVMLYASDYLPGGWTPADGRLLSVSSNSGLYSALGTAYGGNGATTFALPDLRGRAAVGTGTGAGLSNYNRGQAVGAEQVTLSEAHLPAHRHSLPSGGMTGFTGGGQPEPNLQPGLALNYGIASAGYFPPNGGSGYPNDDRYLAQIGLFAGQSLPANHFPADGRLLAIGQNQAFFSLLQFNYGGNGTSTFGIPDLRGRLAMHEGTGAGLSDRPLGQLTGAEQVTLTEAQIPAHRHSLPLGEMTGSTGGSQPQPNMQPSQTLNYIIATSGNFPNNVDADGAFMGQIRLIAGNYEPEGWKFCDGQVLSIAQNQALFALLQSNYGGNGISTFALPDLRGRVPIGAGAGPGLTNRVSGAMVGTEQVTLTEANLPPHSHILDSIPGDFNHDGRVDAADYVFWRKAAGSQSDYSTWRAHFGDHAGSGSDVYANTAVPEPATWVMLMFAMAGCCVRQGRAK